MKGTNRYKLLSIILVMAYLLSACSGAATQSASPAGGGKPEAKEVAFTGTVEDITAGEITVSGQVVALDAATILDQNIQVGDIVKVEARVSDTGAVLALKVESFGTDDANTNPGNANDDGANVNANTNDNTNTSPDDNSNTGVDNANSNDSTGGVVSGTEQEIFGVVEALSAGSVTVDGVVYQFGSFTELKDAIFVGDTVKLHVIVNADGSLTVREIEKSDGTVIGDDNSNDDNSNSNTNDDNGNDDNSNGNDDNGNDDNGNDDNSNGNSNGNDD